MNRPKDRHNLVYFLESCYFVNKFHWLMIGTMLLEETPSRIEPCLLDEIGPEIVDLVASVSATSNNLGKRLHPRSAESLADLVRVMNCYYSNLIEGHNTTPREIQQALRNRLDATDERRNLQIEARAHIRVQQDVDRLYMAGKLPEPASVSFILWLNRSFYLDAPDSMLIVQSETPAIRMEPGIFRSSHDHEVSAGRHLPPAAASWPWPRRITGSTTFTHSSTAMVASAAS
jgi:Fic family protein